ncbi:hypothetical protein GCM10025865_02360 [Paraoerskovia sediminicola]|uniref:Heavy metal transporter n=1 Tax=Paraoerskovia sediminicola TaxID=1138587 RepID=A0ABN6XBB0_9CELL|nr:hypothetical protein GCM10025865_02360 [Paraoerskovia sediminicola]
MVGGAVATVVVGGLAVGGVVAALHLLDVEPPVDERCVAAVDGVNTGLEPEQADNAALVALTAVRREMPARAATIGLATAYGESRLRNLDHGDRDSLGMFQQRPSQGWGTVDEVQDPVYATNTFYDALEKVDGYEELRVTEAAWAVQRSAFPEGYQPFADRSRAWASALTGYSPATLTCLLRGVASPAAAADAVSGFTERVTRDLGDVPVEEQAAAPDDGSGAANGGEDGGDADPRATVVVHATGFGGTGEDDAVRMSWAVAQWAVSTASTTDAVAVTVDGRRWVRGEDGWVTDAAGTEELPAGSVRVDLAVATA